MTNIEMAKLTKKAYIEMQIDEVVPDEVYEIYIKPNYETALWRFSEGKHQIVIGSKIFENMSEDVTFEDKTKYLHAYLNHEVAHSIWSERSLLDIINILNEEKIPFKLFNLFEDARIEERMRHHSKKVFNWFKFETHDIPTTAIGIFFYLLQSEHKRSELLKLKSEIQKDNYADLETVFKIYKEVLACESSYALIRVLKLWCKLFPQTLKELEDKALQETLFINEAQYFMDAKAFDALLEDLDNVLVSTLQEPRKEIVHGSINIKNNHVKSENLLSAKPCEIPYDMKLKEMLLAKMEQLFMEPLKSIATAIPSKRLNLKRSSVGSNKLFRRREIRRNKSKKITVILDLSGSMDSVMGNMRLLLDVINTMVQKDLISVTLILTVAWGSASRFQVLPMPLSKSVLERIKAHCGAEGLENTLKQNICRLVQSDYVWILTDGYIDEKPLDKKYFRNYGIITHAMYVGDEGCKVEMERSFNYVVCKNSIEELAQEIFQLIKC